MKSETVKFIVESSMLEKPLEYMNTIFYEKELMDGISSQQSSLVLGSNGKVYQCDTMIKLFELKQYDIDDTVMEV